VVGVTKRFPGILALDRVSLAFEGGRIHALVGENGAGKSTLINLLSGVLPADEGSVEMYGRLIHLTTPVVARRLGISAVHQEPDLFPDLSVAENAALAHGWPARSIGVCWSRLRAATANALAVFGCAIDPAAPASRLTPAQYQLLSLAVALARAESLLILDEPTSSLSESETRILFARLRELRKSGRAILYVSHRLGEIFELADTVTVLRDGREVWTGPMSTTSPARLIALMVGRTTQPIARRPAAPHGPVRFACRALSGADASFQDVSLEVHGGETFGLYGLVGAGRSEWAQAVFGLRPLASGQMMLDGRPTSIASPGEAARQGLVYMPEDRLRQGLCATLPVRANMVLAALRRLAAGPWVARREENRRCQLFVHQLGIRLRSLDQPVGTLSGGNQQKVVLARWLECTPATLLLDEPTRGVDVGAKEEIYALLRGLAVAGHAIVLISSDLPEILAQCDRVGVFREGRLVATCDPRTTSAAEIAALALPIHVADAGSARWAKASGAASNHPALLPSWFRDAGLALAVAALATFLALQTDTFWQAGTLRDTAESAGLLVLAGLGAGLVILAGGIDISFGSVMAMSAALSGLLLRDGWPAAGAAGIGLSVAAAAGGLNAVLSLVGRIHPIVVTLGTMSLYRGVALILIGAHAIHAVPDVFRVPLQGAWLGIPVPVALAVLAVLTAWVLLGWTKGGRHVLALGSNPLAAARTGIRRSPWWLIVFSLQGLLAGVAGQLALARAGHLQATDFEEMTLEAIGVAVVGGIAISGGRGSVWGIWAAAFLFRIMEKGWVLLHIAPAWQRSIVGTLLLTAIVGDQLWRRALARVR
jgi:ABC-type sugar transport system ATPase subunit/ribose/xylose/arabinose/galactoside ABC-type transport system permease subunit